MSINIHDLRRRILSDEPVTKEEIRAAIDSLVPVRQAVTEASESLEKPQRTNGKKAAKPTVDLGDLL